MVLESIISPLRAEEKPWDMFFLGFLFSVVGLFLALWIFRSYASLIMVFLTVFAVVPFVVKMIKLEEKKDTIIKNEMTLLKEHSKAIAVLIFMFLGMVMAYSLLFVILPTEMSNDAFFSQIQTINTINSHVSAKYVNPFETFTNILFNNLRVLSFCILFSFIYGAGAVFILTWNASVIGAAIGSFIRTGIASIATKVGFVSVSGYFQVFYLSLLRYLVHGIPEIIAYFLGGLAGGIISFAVINHDFGGKNFENILLDTSELIILALSMLLVASFLEVYFVPLLF